MDFKLTIVCLFFFLISFTLAVKQMRDITAVAVQYSNLEDQAVDKGSVGKHGVQRRMISVDNFFVFLRLLFFALLLLYVT